MDKIYSRTRIRIPKINRTRGSKKNKFIKIVGITIIGILLIRAGLNAIMPTFNNLCENRAESIATVISNEKATNVMKSHSYEELFEVQKDNDGNIKMIKSNITNINEIISQIAVDIQNEIDNRGRDSIEIALGTFTGLKLLAGRGPAIKIKVSTIGNVETDLKSEFTTQGINQTLHRAYLQVKCKVSILTLFENIETQITNQVLLAENVIIGNIPGAYYNLEGLNTTKDALELIE